MIFDPKPADYKDLLTVFRIGLVQGVVDSAHIISWSDAIVKASKEPDSFFIELSLAKNSNRIIELIDSVPGVGANGVITRALIGILYHVLEEKKLDLAKATTILDNLNSLEILTEVEFEWIVRLYDDYELNITSVIKNESVAENVIGFLSTYRDFNIDNYRSWDEINQRMLPRFERVETYFKDEHIKEVKAEKKERVKQNINKGLIILFLLFCLGIIAAFPLLDPATSYQSGYVRYSFLVYMLFLSFLFGLAAILKKRVERYLPTKELLRRVYRYKRSKLTDAEYNDLNQQLLIQFLELDFSTVKCVHLFLPIIENNEVNTYLLCDWLKANHPEIRIVHPKSNFRTLTMKSYVYDDDLRVETSRYGIPEPKSGNEVEITEIDMIILPLLAFNKVGYRVGYGKGFYDRFCALCKPGTQFIGLSFFEPVERIEDVNEYDVWMHACITPEQIWRWH